MILALVVLAILSLLPAAGLLVAILVFVAKGWLTEEELHELVSDPGNWPANSGAGMYWPVGTFRQASDEEQ